MSAYITSMCVISPQFQYIGIDENWLDKAVIYNSKFLRCLEPDYKVLISPAQLRRLPRILKIGLYTALNCVIKSSNPDAIVIGTGSGCLEELEKFMSLVIDNKNEVLSPASFILSTSNIVGSQVAMVTGNNNYNMNYVSRCFAFENALNDALMLIEENNAQNVLVGGIDEVTDYHHKVFDYLNYWKPLGFNSDNLYKSDSQGTIAGEGSAFFNVSSLKTPDSIEIKGVSTIFKPESQAEIKSNLNSFLDSNKTSAKDIDLLILGNNGDNQYDSIYNDFTNINFNANQPAVFYKGLCGEYYTSTGFALGVANYILKTQKIPSALYLKNDPPKNIKTILIYNQFRNKEHSFILLEK